MGGLILYRVSPLLLRGKSGKSIKLNELIAVNRKASNRLLNVEDLSKDELCALHEFFGKLADRAKSEATLSISHSIEEAEEIHEEKGEDLEERHAARKHLNTTKKKPVER